MSHCAMVHDDNDDVDDVDDDVGPCYVRNIK